MKLPSLTALLAAGAISLCAEQTNEPAPARKPECCTRAETPGKPLSDRSLYQADSRWTRDAGDSVQLKALRGRPQVITMFFATCNFACPILVHDMKRIEQALPESLRGKVGFTLVSFDTERDTPAALRAYRQRMELKENWTLLRGGADDVLELAALLGVKFRKEASGQFAHSNVIFILNAEGEIANQIAGLNQDVTAALNKLETLTQESHAATATVR